VLKTVSSEFCDMDGVEREIALVEGLPVHPNIVRYLYHTRTEKGIYLFMTRYAGSLADAIKVRVEYAPQVQTKRAPPPSIISRNHFQPQQIKQFIRDIATGLKFLHKHRIIHRGTPNAPTCSPLVDARVSM